MGRRSERRARSEDAPVLAPGDAPRTSPVAFLTLASLAVYLTAGVVVPGEGAGVAVAWGLSCLAWLPAILCFLVRPLPRAPARLSFPAPALCTAALVFAACVGAGAGRSDSPHTAAAQAVTWLAHIAIFFAVASLGDAPGRALLLLASFLATAAALGAHGLHQHFIAFDVARAEVAAHPELVPVGEPVRHEFLARLETALPFSTFITRNVFAGFLALSLPPLLGWRLDARREHPRDGVAELALGLIPLLVLGTTLGLTQSKGGLAAAGAGLGTMLLLVGAARLRGRGRPLRWWAGSLAAAGLLGLLLLATGVVDPLALRRPESSMGLRAGYWLGAWRVLGEHPLFGAGLDGFANHYLRLKGPVAGETIRAHNDWLQIAAELGVTGLLAYAVCWGTLVTRAAASLLRGVRLPAAGPPPGSPAATGTGDGAPEREAAETGAPHATREEILAVGVSGLGTLLVVSELTGCFGTNAGQPLWWGLVGLWGVTFVPLVRRGLPRDPFFLRCGLVSGLVAYLVHGLVDHPAYVAQVAAPAWAAAGLLVALDRSGTLCRRVDFCPAAAGRRAWGAGLLLAGLAFTGLLVPACVRNWVAEGLLARAEPIAAGGTPDPVKTLEAAMGWAPANALIWRELAQARHRRCLTGFGASVAPEEVARVLAPCAAAIDAAIERDPTNAGLWFERGRLAYDHARALEAVAGAARADATAALRQRIARDLERALESFRAAAQRYPGKAEYRYWYARLLDGRAGQREAATHEYSEAVHLSEEGAREWQRLAPEEEAAARRRLRQWPPR